MIAAIYRDPISLGGSGWTNRNPAWLEKTNLKKVSSSGAFPAASGIVVRSHDATIGCEFDLVRKRPDHGSGLRPWMPNSCGSFAHARVNPISLTQTPPCEPVWHALVGGCAGSRRTPDGRLLCARCARSRAVRFPDRRQIPPPVLALGHHRNRSRDQCRLGLHRVGPHSDTALSRRRRAGIRQARRSAAAISPARAAGPCPLFTYAAIVAAPARRDRLDG